MWHQPRVYRGAVPLLVNFHQEVSTDSIQQPAHWTLRWQIADICAIIVVGIFIIFISVGDIEIGFDVFVYRITLDTSMLLLLWLILLWLLILWI
jgi:hypothetical protein